MSHAPASRARNSAYLLILGHRAGLEWVMRNSRMAFTEERAKDGAGLAVGDRLFLYATRGCFRNPTRDRGRVIGEASVVSPPAELDEPVRFGEHEFLVGVSLRIETLAPRFSGVELAPLVERLHAFPERGSWSARMRRALVPLDEHDARLLERELRRAALPYPSELASYSA